MRHGGAGVPRKVIAQNRRARHQYEVLDTLEVGIALLGTEVKSLRAGNLSFQDAHAVVRNGELWLRSMHIGRYREAGLAGHEPTRTRRLLAHRHEIRRLGRAVEEKGLTLVPLSAYFVGGRVKLEVGVARGRKLHDRREELKRREQDRDAQRAMSRP